MSDRRANLLYAAGGLGLAYLLAWALDAHLELSFRSGLWFEILVLVLVAAFLLEPRFTGGGAAAANCVAAILIALGADRTKLEAWWIALLVAAIVGLLLLILSYALNDPNRERSARPNRVARAALQLGTALGSWRCVLLAALALALSSFNPAFGREWTVAIVVTVYVLAMVRVQPHRLVLAIRGAQAFGDELTVVEINAPHQVIVTGRAISELRTGTPVRVSSEGRDALGITAGRITFQGAQAVRLFVPELYSALPQQPATLATVAVTVLEDWPGVLEPFGQELAHAHVELTGLLAQGTSMREAVIEITSSQQVRLGQVLWTAEPNGRTFWQATDGEVRHTSWGADARLITTARANQIGVWDPALPGFTADMRTPKPVDIAFAGEVPAPAVVLHDGQLAVGDLPGSPFPVVVDVAQLSRHHTAILGTTGTGKTHLAFAIAEKLANIGTKVICIDHTGQYSIRFPDAPTIKSGEVSAFLAGDQNLAIYQLGDLSPIAEVNGLARNLNKWSSTQTPLESHAPARCVLFFEEAQNYVPETFVIDDWNLKAKAQDTSLVVMESRKYGLGFVIVSQRTAMVTKSALSQCNTVFAFQAVDQTGLDYLEGLCGPALVRGLPTLPHRTALVVGRGLVSTTPLIVYVDDAPIVVA